MEYDVKIAKIDMNLRVDWDKLSESTRKGIIEYGLRQLLNDAHAAIALKDGDTEAEARTKRAEIEAAVNKRLDALEAGTYRFGSGGGGKRVSAVEQALREIVEEILRGKGMAAADAKAAARTPEATVRELSAKKAKESGEDAEALFTRNWSAIRGKAEKIAALKNTDTDI